MISLILVILAAICNAVMDVTSFHYEKSIFSKLNPKWWNPYISWKNKYVNWDGGKRTEKTIWLGIKYPTALTDAWHLFKSTMITLLVLAIVLYTPFINLYVDFAIIGIGWNVAFNLFYNKIFKLKS